MKKDNSIPKSILYVPLVAALGVSFLSACASQQAPQQSQADNQAEQGAIVFAQQAESERATEAPGNDSSENLSAANLDVLTSQVDNPYFQPLASLLLLVYEGEEEDDDGEIVKLRVESRVLPETERIGDSDVTVVQVEQYEDNELIDRTWDFYAQDSDGAIIYMGEAVDEIEDGKVVAHTGQWRAGDGINKPGTFIPANPKVGDSFTKEQVPGIAEEEAEVVAVGLSLTTDAGSFVGCIQIQEHDPLEDVTEFKFYCPGIGLVREEFDEGHLDLVSISKFEPKDLDEELIEDFRRWVGF